MICSRGLTVPVLPGNKNNEEIGKTGSSEKFIAPYLPSQWEGTKQSMKLHLLDYYIYKQCNHGISIINIVYNLIKVRNLFARITSGDVPVYHIMSVLMILGHLEINSEFRAESVLGKILKFSIDYYHLALMQALLIHSI